MLRRLTVAAFLIASAQAAILPDHFAGAPKKAAQARSLSDQVVWDEYGLEEFERAGYGGLSVTAYRMRDPTSALGVFQWLRPADAYPSKLAELAVEYDAGTLVAYGNYVLQFEGGRPQGSALATLYGVLPRLDQSSLPTLAGFIPAQNRVPNSERYILGPVTLERFFPALSPALAAFSLGAEAQMAKYRTGPIELTMALFSYPTPQIARQRVEEFQNQPMLVAKRTGPLVAVIARPIDRDAAERLLALVRYNATITWSEPTKARKSENWGVILISIFTLTGMLLAGCLVAGIVLGGFRVYWRRLLGKKGEESMTVLHLKDR